MMIKEAVVGLFSQAPNRTLADRYYLRFHGPDVVRISGPWLRRYESYRAYDPPPEAVERFGAQLDHRGFKPLQYRVKNENGTWGSWTSLAS